MMKLPLLLLSAFALPLQAAQLDSASVTRVINDVRILTPQKAARPAKNGDQISGSTSLQTGRRSRAEVTFLDKTITRVGANSLFSLSSKRREVELNSGSMLLQVPKGKGATHIRTATVTAAITGTTLMMEYSVGNWVKLIVIEGEVKLAINGQKRAVTIGPGQIVVMDPKGRVVPEVMDINLQRLLDTSQLMSKKLFGPLPPSTESLISAALKKQKAAIESGAMTALASSAQASDQASQAIDTTTTSPRNPRGPDRTNNIPVRPVTPSRP